MNEMRIIIVVGQAARILRENPKLTYRQAIAKAKEVLGYEEIANMRKTY